MLFNIQANRMALQRQLDRERIVPIAQEPMHVSHADLCRPVWPYRIDMKRQDLLTGIDQMESILD